MTQIIFSGIDSQELLETVPQEKKSQIKKEKKRNKFTKQLLEHSNVEQWTRKYIEAVKNVFGKTSSCIAYTRGIDITVQIIIPRKTDHPELLSVLYTNEGSRFMLEEIVLSRKKSLSFPPKPKNPYFELATNSRQISAWRNWNNKVAYKLEVPTFLTVQEWNSKREGENEV